MQFYVLTVAIALGLFGSCGRTTVDTGKNAQRPDDPQATSKPEKKTVEGLPEAPSISQPEIPGETNEMRPAEVESEKPAAAGVASGAEAAKQPISGKITCFGPSADVAPVELKEFCEAIPTEVKEFYASAHKILCVDRKLHNLFLAQCGWTGSNEFKSFFQVLAKTSLREKSDEFYYLSTASLTLGPSDYSYPDMALVAYSDPSEFAKKFHLPAGAVITPDGKGVIESDQSKIARYKFEVNGLTKTSFDGEIRVVKYGANLRAVFNTAIGGYEGLKRRQNLTWSPSLQMVVKNW